MPSETDRPGAGTPQRFPIVEERAAIDVVDRIVGRVRVTTRNREEEVQLAETLQRLEVEIERIPIDRPIDHVPQIREEDGVTIVPVVEEVLVRQLVLREEIHVRSAIRERPVERSVKLRVQDAVIERLPGEES